MSLTEFSLIDGFFRGLGSARSDVETGIGDDAAVVQPEPDTEIMVGMATFVDGAEFSFAETPANVVAHRVLALGLARLAATGSAPAWLTLSLTLPRIDEDWVRDFSTTLDALSTSWGMGLVGGDTTRGPARISLQCHGVVPSGQAIPSRPQPGDLVYVTGELGDAGLALLARQGEVRLPVAVERALAGHLDFPSPPVLAGQALRGRASGAVVVWDGLERGLERLTRPTGLGATLHAEALPVSRHLSRVLDQAGGWSLPLRATHGLALCFSVPGHLQADTEAALAGPVPGCHWIGTIDRRSGVRCVSPTGSLL